MISIFWTGKLRPTTKIMVNLNSMLAFLRGKTRNTSAMKHRIKLGYSDTVSKHIQNYDTVGIMHYYSIANILLDGVSVTGKTVLDVGCGNGGFLRALRVQFPRWGLSGTEFDRRNEKALRKIGGFRKLYDSQSTPPAASFDLISLVHVLEH
ncbi:MAG: methyltransferase domain-containing protein, partial [Candidatus Omnitrophica bacterium]|nr:methyltransferase domain-containing protein [Candidatus Omnitrophota bacterium]